MRRHSLEIHVQPDGKALCFIGELPPSSATPSLHNVHQQLTLRDAENLVFVFVCNRKIGLPDIQRIARQAVDGTFERV